MIKKTVTSRPVIQTRLKFGLKIKLKFSRVVNSDKFQNPRPSINIREIQDFESSRLKLKLNSRLKYIG